jgi:hypothetical protein
MMESFMVEMGVVGVGVWKWVGWYKNDCVGLACRNECSSERL